MNDPVLLPRPRLMFLDGSTVQRGQDEHYTDPSVPPEGYRLAICDGGVVSIASADAAGRFYAEQTLRQLEQNYDGEVPVGEIRDWPDLAVRAVMLDISRDKVPTVETLLALIDRLSGWKINQVQLYSEHTFAYSGHEEVWRDSSPFGPEEIHSIDEHCAKRHVELVPNQNCLGHMERWLRHDRYRPLALQPEGFEFFGTHRDPSTLDPTDAGAFELVRALLAELLPNFQSRRVNVGLDEPWELGEDRVEDYLDWVHRLRDCTELDGYEMLMWGDIVRGRPELVARIPSDVTICEWGYEADHPFSERAGVFAEADRAFWTCPGTSSWISILGRWTNAHDNILAAADAAVSNGGVGLLNTDWGDLGHLQYLPVSLAPLAYGAATSWCTESNRDLDVATALDMHVFEDPTRSIGSSLLALGDLHRELSAQMVNMSMLAMPLYMPRLVLGKGPAEGLTAEQFEAVTAGLVTCQDRLGRASPGCEDGRLVLDELGNAIELVAILCEDGRSRLRDGDGSLESIPEANRAELARRLGVVHARHRELWLRRNRPGGLEDSCSRLLRLQRCYETGSTDGVPMYG